MRFRNHAQTALPKIPICVRRHRGWKRQHLHKREREAQCGFHENNLPGSLLNSTELKYRGEWTKFGLPLSGVLSRTGPHGRRSRSIRIFSCNSSEIGKMIRTWLEKAMGLCKIPPHPATRTDYGPKPLMRLDCQAAAQPIGNRVPNSKTSVKACVVESNSAR